MLCVPYYIANWPTAVTGEADSFSSVSASARHIGGAIGVNPVRIGVSLRYHALWGLY